MTPTDQELEKVATDTAVEIFKRAGSPQTRSLNRFYDIILSALKQVQPNREGIELLKEARRRIGHTAWPSLAKRIDDFLLVDSIAVSPQEQISATPQNVPSDVRE